MFIIDDVFIGIGVTLVISFVSKAEYSAVQGCHTISNNAESEAAVYAEYQRLKAGLDTNL